MNRMIAVMTLAALAISARAAHAELKAGDHFVELDAHTAAGKKFRLKDMAGKWVVFTFGASWCGPCHKELPAWDSVAPKLAGKALFVAVNIDNNHDDGKRFVDSLKLKHVFPVFMPADTSTAIKSYDPDRMPSSFVIDPAGIVRAVRYGYEAGDESSFAEQLTGLIK